MRLAVIGAGYVGLVTGVGLARLGHEVAVGEADPDRLDLLRRGVPPIHEPGLEEALRSAISAGTIAFHSSNAAAARDAEVVFIAVPTPPARNGEADISRVEQVADDIAPVLGAHSAVVLRSTVPVGTTRRIQERLRAAGADVAVVANPEFLQAGRAMQDFFEPSRIVIGADDHAAASKVELLFAPFQAPVVVTDPVSAELIKYGANAYLATRLAFVNELADLCAAVEADAGTVLAGVGYDPRIGAAFLSPGPGFGGSCLPKDSRALVSMAAAVGGSFRTVESALLVNEAQRRRNLERVVQALGGEPVGATVCLWGLSFKAGTDDVRESPAMWLVEDLHALGVAVRAFDELARVDDLRIERLGDPVEAAKGADAVIVTTEWTGWRDVDLRLVAAAMRGASLVDLRGVLDGRTAAAAGLDYFVLRHANGGREPRPDDRRDLLSA